MRPDLAGTNVFSRTSRGGPFGGSIGTCGIMERIAETLGRDVAAWAQLHINAPALKPDTPLQ